MDDFILILFFICVFAFGWVCGCMSESGIVTETLQERHIELSSGAYKNGEFIYTDDKIKYLIEGD